MLQVRKVSKKMPNDDTARLSVFVSYCHKDQRWLQRLKVHLRPLEREYDIDIWNDTRLTPGSRWREEIKMAVDKANVAILIVSADFLGSEFIHTDELPPLLRAAEEEGALILPIIVGHSLFLRTPELCRFQAVNDPSTPLVSAPEGEQEATFVRVAESVLHRARERRTRSSKAPSELRVATQEKFSEDTTWKRLIKIGDWILDEDRGIILGSGVRAYLLSRGEYGETEFDIQASLEFTNFQPPKDKRLGMNAGIVFGWKAEQGSYRYYNVLLTGSELLIERVGFRGGKEADFEHVTAPIPLRIEAAQPIRFKVQVGDNIRVNVNNKHYASLKRPTGVVGRVGLRPWRSQIGCTEFTVTKKENTARSGVPNPSRAKNT